MQLQYLKAIDLCQSMSVEDLILCIQMTSLWKNTRKKRDFFPSPPHRPVNSHKDEMAMLAGFPTPHSYLSIQGA